MRAIGNTFHKILYKLSAMREPVIIICMGVQPVRGIILEVESDHIGVKVESNYLYLPLHLIAGIETTSSTDIIQTKEKM